jgi:hypothetical protein
MLHLLVITVNNCFDFERMGSAKKVYSREIRRVAVSFVVSWSCRHLILVHGQNVGQWTRFVRVLCYRSIVVDIIIR